MQKNLEFVGVYDNPDTGYCFNVYIDNSIGSVYVQRMWNNKGVTVVSENGAVKEITLSEFDSLGSEAGE